MKPTRFRALPRKTETFVDFAREDRYEAAAPEGGLAARRGNGPLVLGGYLHLRVSGGRAPGIRAGILTWEQAPCKVRQKTPGRNGRLPVLPPWCVRHSLLLRGE